MLWLALLYAGAGVLLVAISIPLIQRRIKPNPFYGFRVPKTYSNEQTWYEANAYSGKWLLGAGVVISISAVGFALIPGITTDVYAWSVTGVALAALGLAVVQSFRYLNRIA